MFPALLAQAAVASGALNASNPTVFMGLLMAAGFALVGAANQVDAMIQRRKRTPPIESEFVTKQEFRDFTTRVETELRINRIAVEKLTSSINKDFTALWRGLGKVEGITLPAREARDDE